MDDSHVHCVAGTVGLMGFVRKQSTTGERIAPKVTRVIHVRRESGRVKANGSWRA